MAAEDAKRESFQRGRRFFLKLTGLLGVAAVGGAIGYELYRGAYTVTSQPTLKLVDTLRLEEYALNSINFFDRVVDEKYLIPEYNGISYWQVFLLQNPPMMCHSSTDYANQTGNSLTAIITQRLMLDPTVGAASEQRLKDLLLKFLATYSGFYGFWELPTPWNSRVAGMSENGYGMLGLVTWYQQDKDPEVKAILDKMVESLWSIASVDDSSAQATMPNHVYTPNGWSGSTNNYDLDLGDRQGYLILPLVRYYEISGSNSSLKLAKYLINYIIAHRDETTGRDAWVKPDGSFVLNVPGEAQISSGYDFRGHGERVMRSFAGIAEYAAVTNDRELLDWSRSVFDYFHQFSEGFLESEANGMNVKAMWAGTVVTTKDRGFGWYPENITLYDVSEASTILWTLYVAIVLARSGYPQYWHIVERIARNHLLESQLRDVNWVPSGGTVSVTNLATNGGRCSWDDVARRCLGGFAGWSGGDVFVGSREQYQNAPSMMNDGEIMGLGYYLIWHNIVTKDDSGVWVNVSISRDTEWVLVNSHLPYEGRVEIQVHDAPVLFLNVPDWVDKSQVSLMVNLVPVKKKWKGDYLKVSSLASGDVVAVLYPLRTVNFTQFVGGFYGVQWLGDTVVSISPTSTTKQFTSPNYGLLYQRRDFSGPAPIRSVSTRSTQPSPPELSFPL